jgi:peroxiredoxin Q/BCP
MFVKGKLLMEIIMAPDFTLQAHTGKSINLFSCLKESSVMLVFYPGDFTPVCTKQLCDYRDHMADFKDLGVQILGLSQNDQETHAKFVKKYEFSFLLLTDVGNDVAKAYGCSSIFMFGKISRAIVLVNMKGELVYKYVEPTGLTRRKSQFLLEVLKGGVL